MPPDPLGAALPGRLCGPTTLSQPGYTHLITLLRNMFVISWANLSFLEHIYILFWLNSLQLNQKDSTLPESRSVYLSDLYSFLLVVTTKILWSTFFASANPGPNWMMFSADWNEKKERKNGRVRVAEIVQVIGKLKLIREQERGLRKPLLHNRYCKTCHSHPGA